MCVSDFDALVCEWGSVQSLLGVKRAYCKPEAQRDAEAVVGGGDPIAAAVEASLLPEDGPSTVAESLVGGGGGADVIEGVTTAASTAASSTTSTASESNVTRVPACRCLLWLAAAARGCVSLLLLRALRVERLSERGARQLHADAGVSACVYVLCACVRASRECLMCSSVC